MLQIPLVVLADYKLSDEDYGNLNQENFFGMNITAIEHSVARLLDDQQVGARGGERGGAKGIKEQWGGGGGSGDRAGERGGERQSGCL